VTIDTSKGTVVQIKSKHKMNIAHMTDCELNEVNELDEVTV